LATGLYIHIPFCHARCGYCDFVTFTGKEDRIEAYVEALQAELNLYIKKSPLAPRRSHATIFFGGGTPSLLTPQQVTRILEHIRKCVLVSADAEITMEANPESVTLEKAIGWRQAGVNRLSIGLQAMDDALLKAMDRLHTVDEFHQAYKNARQAGFTNLNVDLIYGFSGQSLEAWKDTLDKTLVLNPEHLSLYALAIEEHTPFAAQHVTVNSDLQAEMYAWARQRLAAAGYPQYEISNFSRPGYECRHNLIYWRQEDYLALGVGAVGCVGNQRWTNHKTLHAYEKDLEDGRLPRQQIETLTDQEQRFERLMLGLRLREGLAWEEEQDPLWKKARTHLLQEGHLEEIYPGRWRITDPSVAYTNQVLLPFLK